MPAKPMSTATADVAVVAAQPVVQHSRIRALWGLTKRKPLGAAAASILLLLVFTAIFADVLAPYDPLFTRPEIRLAPPSWQHPFGTDDIGRDVLSRIIYGTRLSLWVGLLAVGIGTVAGTLIGLICGYWEGWLDLGLQRVMDALMTIPGLILALAIVSVLTPIWLGNAIFIEASLSFLGLGTQPPTPSWASISLAMRCAMCGIPNSAVGTKSPLSPCLYLLVLGERCRADALLIRVKTVQSEPCFANTANAPLSSQLDIIQERGGGPCKGTALRSRVGGRKKARRAMPWGRRG